MTDKFYPKSELPIRKTSELLPQVFQTNANDKFLSGVLDPLVQPGVLDKVVGYIGRRYGKTYNGSDIYLDTDQTLRSRYQLEPAVTVLENDKVKSFYDYLDFKNQLKFFGNTSDRDDKTTAQDHYSWNPPVDWDKFINYREYYWMPLGPEPVSIFGQNKEVNSTYKVSPSTGESWIFSPDGVTNNPSITLYRGQTYNFKVSSPAEGFTIRTNYDTGSLLFDPNKFYFPGQLAVFDNKLWRAISEVSPVDGSTIDIDSEDWELIDSSVANSSFNYDKGVENNGVTNGTLTFTVPYDAPDTLYYQSDVLPDRLGKFIIADIEANTFVDVDKEILGKTSYTSGNNITFTNGLVVEFTGEINPEKYTTGRWLVTGVGDSISLTKFEDLVPPILTTETPEVLFDNDGFDTQPYDDAAQFPVEKDYIIISPDSNDSNPWSRYNRWFHRSVIEFAANINGSTFDASEDARAKRPIIEFKPNVKLFNHGATAKTTVDYIDTVTTDVFSNIEGSIGYSIDGEFLFEGARILVVADTDILANNKIYEVKFITHNSSTIINLQETDDSDSLLDECVLVRRGQVNSGLMYHFNGTNWVRSQEKTQVNQPPLFNAYDANGVSFADEETYPVSTFTGTKLLSYKEGNSVIDTELGFSLSYLNIDNIGDIEFEWNFDTDTFEYTENQILNTLKIQKGFYKVGNNFDNGWIETDLSFIQPIIDSAKLNSVTNEVTFNTVDWTQLTENAVINFYLNGEKIDTNYSRNGSTFTFDNNFSENDILVIKIIDDIEPDQGYYEIPTGIEKNPLNQNINSFTLGQAINHISSALEFNSEIDNTIPGNSNLRDLSSYKNNAERFLKHSGVSVLPFVFLCDKEQNLIKSLKYAKQAYTTFKNNFLEVATKLDFSGRSADFVDEIINNITKTKTIKSPFVDSDMIGSGAFTAIDYTVEDEGIKTFSLSQSFNLTEASTRAVYVYLNDVQLLHNAQYTFDDTFGFVLLNVDLIRGDKIEIREYVSTTFNHIPPTPTSLGLYKKYTPQKFIDDTYLEPREVIQGHDGSIVPAYGDFRDDLLLELEYRIYNNIKSNYDPDIFDIDSVLGGYNGQGEFTKPELDQIVSQEFLNWVSNTGVNYASNTYFDSENPFTYTYTNMTDPTGTQNLPGFWRGVYQWFYDTDRPHRCPWECLGFSEKPTWWDDEYGEAPYTRGNLLLWEDIRDGIIRQGPRAGTYERYARPTIIKHIPVDDDGNLLDPLTSGLAGNFTLVNNQGSFQLGDVAPVEYAWRSSSEWPFAVMIALSLLKPFNFINKCLDNSLVVNNIIGQIVSKETNYFLTPSDVKVPVPGQQLTTGLINYIASYVRSLGLETDIISDTISNIDISLSSRLSGFVDKGQQKYLLDSKNPNSTSGSIFIPPENYDIIFNISSPIQSVSYSGVVVEKTNRGWSVIGYDSISPYFNYYDVVPNQKDPLITVGGISETYVDWTPDQKYNNGSIVLYRNDYYRALQTHTSAELFDTTLWNKLPTLPVKNAVEAQRRRTFNKLKVKQITYGHEFNTIQQVVDFLLGYEEYLKSIGFVFDNYDTENQVSQDWTTSCKEFMFWTKHNWSEGSIITLSPSATKIKTIVPVGVVDNLLDGFYDYNVLKSDGTPLDSRFIDINREFQSFTITTTETTEGIYFLKLNYVLKEHVVVFDDKTVFNDVIYDKTTGYRQERIKSRGFRTVDWDGDYTSPGFLFDNVNIEAWQPFRDYNLGDIVSYRSINWVSKTTHSGKETFDDTIFSRLDSEPQKQLVPNFDYRVNQFEDYFETGAEGVAEVQRQLARSTIGYSERPYLNDLSEDDITQYKLYQGFIREKGTNNSLNKLFTKLSQNNEETSLILKEEWAFKVGEFGGTEQSTETEFQFEIDNFELNPQPLLIESTIPDPKTDKFYRVTGRDFTISSIPYATDIIPASYNNIPVKTAGYVKLDQIDWTIKNRELLNSLDINEVKENDHIWITFDGPSWTVLRFNQLPGVFAENFVLDSTNSIVRVSLNKESGLEIGDFCGIRDVENLTGFFEVVNKQIIRTEELRTFILDISVPSDASDPEFEVSSGIGIYALTQSRFSDYDSLDPQSAALLDENNKLWIDNNGNDQWEVIEKKKQFTSKKITNFGLIDPARTGSKVVYNSILNQSAVAIPTPGFVVIYTESTNDLSVRQILTPAPSLTDTVSGIFAEEIAISPDSKWMAVGTPLASGIDSRFKGPYTPIEGYNEDDIVLYEGKLWKALETIPANVGEGIDDSTWIGPETERWEPATIIKAESNTTEGFTQQGVITLYEFSNNQWTRRDSFVSPRPSPRELFGSSIKIGVADDNYYMAVSAPGAEDSKGRVYLYIHDGTEWKHAENVKYRGIYNQNTPVYYAGDIVWYDGNLFECLDNSTEYVDVSKTVDLSYTGNWLKIDPVATQNSLPQSVSIEDDGSTLASGILNSDQMAELVKSGDKFGTSVAMNYDASILVVGAPFADGQYFSNYKGLWQPNYEYSENDVVKYDGNYHQLTNIGDTAVGLDSTITSFNEEPGGYPWVEVGDSSTDPSGKVFIYQRSNTGTYELKQTVSAENFINETGNTISINSGDEFGSSIDIDYTGTTIVASSPKSDLELTNQGSAYVLRTNSVSNIEYKLVQSIQSYEKYPNEFFGFNVSISPDTSKIAVGATNAEYKSPIRFDSSSTSFDEGKTSFYSSRGTVGSVYVYELKDNLYFLTEKLESDLILDESFGYSVDCTNSVIVVGSPTYETTGLARVFRKDPTKNSWEILSQQTPSVELEKIKSISLYDNVNNVKILDLDYVDPAKLKILNEAEQEIEFKTPYDPAAYTVGTENTVVDEDIAWTTKQVGKLWWDISTAKWIDYEQGDTAYRTGNWGVLAEGASINVYEWIESPLLPSEWSVLADTTEGLAEGISGQPLYADDSVYSVKVLYNIQTLEPTETLYYYWVKNTVIVPPNKVGRKISSAAVANLIENPAANNTFIVLAASDKLIAYNFGTVVNEDTALMNLEFYKQVGNQNAVHKEYQLISEGVADSLPNDQLENKWIDSLIGYDRGGNRVPDTRLPVKQQYGLKVRPRQSMFIDRLPILETTIKKINTVLQEEPFADNINLDNLNLVDGIPDESLNLYDISVDSFIDLETVGTVRIKQAVLRSNLIDGSIDTIDIVDPGYGYQPRDRVDQEAPGLYVGPPVEFEGNGTGAKAVSHIDGQGRIVNVIVLDPGKKYSSIVTKVRNFSVLVESDSTANNFWSIYAWDDVRKTFFRSRSQGFDTTRYWNYVDWWAPDYNASTRIVKEIGSVSEEPTINVEVGDLIKVKEYAAGGWAVFEKQSNDTQTLLDNYTLVGRENGTIELSSGLYDVSVFGIGFDTINSFDTGYYDVENSNELRNILKAVKEDIFIGDYTVEWNNLFFASIRYVFAEQTYVDWAFKTSFLNAIHNVGSLRQKTNYKNDSLESYREYINEVKPYKTTVREYTSRYTKLENSQTAVGDFDLPPVYSKEDGKVVSVNSLSSYIDQYPWKLWADNRGYSITSIELSSQGSGYVQPPTVLIEGDGTGATAQAYISSGKVVAVRVVNEGTGYTTARVTLVGGNDNASTTARAIAILGKSAFRNLNLTLKFDRYTKDGLYNQTSVSNETFTATGSSAVFDLKYAPTRDKSKISVTLNGQTVLDNEYTISLFTSTTDTYSLLKGKIRFEDVPAAGDEIVVSYEKNDNLLDSVNRINKYYTPSTGMKGADLNQLMTGIDFGGVQVQGTTFDVTGGWDALPWFTDNWDSVEASSDFYVVVDGSTVDVITLPYVPTNGQAVNIYLKRKQDTLSRSIDSLQYSEEIVEAPTVRIDDPNFGTPEQTNDNALLPTFIGDNSTNAIDVGTYVRLEDGDTLIFRPEESDGSVTITDNNIVDTNITGGSLATMNGAYSTATGTFAEDISIDGDKFISPDQVPATEENIPGQVLDSVSIKVYTSDLQGTAPLKSKIVYGDNSTASYDIGQSVVENKSVLVFIDKVQQTLDTDYVIDYENNTVVFVDPPVSTEIVEIISLGVGGVSIIDYQEFTADGRTLLFTTKARFDETSSVFVTVNGEQIESEFSDTGDFGQTPNLTLIQFAEAPAVGSVIKVVSLGGSFSTPALTRINQQTSVFDGSSRSIEVVNFNSSTERDPLSSLIVEVNNVALQGVDTNYFTVSDDNLVEVLVRNDEGEIIDIFNEYRFEIGNDPLEGAGSILTENIRVKQNGTELRSLIDYVYDGINKNLIFSESLLSTGDIIIVENNFRTEYSITDGIVSINSSVALTEGDEINIIWFNEYPSIDLLSDEYAGGKVNYVLKYQPISSEFIWVYANGARLTSGVDYRFDVNKNSIYLKTDTTESDTVKVVIFGTQKFRLPSAYEIHKDMLNIHHYKRYSSGNVQLSKELNYYDTTIEVTNGTLLGEPNSERNIPGVIEINKERIEYFVKSGNVLSQLRRGANGTSIVEYAPTGEDIIDLGVTETIPYSEEQERYDFYSDGSSDKFGPLPFIPSKTEISNWYRGNPESFAYDTDYGQCDNIEVFVAGRRLRKAPIAVYDETEGASSPAADTQLEAEFAVDGESNEVFINPSVLQALKNDPTDPNEADPSGVRVSIIRKIGKTWYDQGNNTASAGITLLENESAIAKFIADKSTDLPE